MSPNFGLITQHEDDLSISLQLAGEGGGLCGGSCTCMEGSNNVGPGLFLPQSAGFQCTSHCSSFDRDSSPRHVAFPQTSSCVVIRGCFPPIAAPGYFFLPVVWHGPKLTTFRRSIGHSTPSKLHSTYMPYNVHDCVT